MLKALIESASQFPQLPPDGYEEGEIRWILELNEAGSANLVWCEKGSVRKKLPMRGDRSGKVSEENVKPALLVDKAAYALGLRTDGVLDRNCLEHREFRRLVRSVSRAWPSDEPARIRRFLIRLHRSPDRHLGALRREIEGKIKPKDVVAFRFEGADFPFESREATEFWRRHLEAEYQHGAGTCCLCGENRSILRILPAQVSIGRYSCPIAAFNSPAFWSFGREQTANSPMCFSCASTATRMLQYLVGSKRHCRDLTRDGSKGQGESPLRNQWAIFWLKDPGPIEVDGAPMDVEALFAIPLSSSGLRDSASPPADPGQIRRLYGLPFSPSGSAVYLDQNKFYVAVLSPNKSRLVLREWMEQTVGQTVEKLEAYDAARTIHDEDGTGEWRPDIPALIEALKPWKVTSASPDANLVRGGLRTAYQGAKPPEALLEQAVLRFRIPDRAKTKSDGEELSRRRQNLIAAIKFVLTYDKQEAITLQSLDIAYSSGPYLCGRLLAILEEAQSRASRWRVQATIVDRYYGGASTAPAATFSVLINQGTKAHMPKIRKIGAGYQELERCLEDVITAIDDQGGFPSTLTLRQQGEFALGFYHQRASFRSQRPSAQHDSSGPERSSEEKTA
jgi:CRISPR-associated protein Csd1